jgi:pyruvate dehydrogenase E2 component (dihydrolipoamide acetyltransferase)
MATPILMPQQGNTVEECLLVSWKKKKGDAVQKGEIVAEVETDKATFELESPASGTLLDLFFKEGELIPVLTPIAVVGSPGESADAFKPEKRKPKPVAPSASTLSAPSPATPSQNRPHEGVATRPSPRARAYMKRHPVDLSGVQGTGPQGRITEKDLQDARSSGARLSPLAGEILEQGAKAPVSGSGQNRTVMAGDLTQPGKPLSGIRAVIAERMVDSLLSTAQYTITMQAPAAGLLELRKEVKAKSNGPAVTIGDMVMFACVAALKEFPDLNAELIGGALYIHKDVHLGFACDTPKGLLVPVIRNCRLLSLGSLAKAAHDLAQQALAGKISPENLTGGSFTVSNLGASGVISFTPVLNAPQVAILGVCAITTAAVRRDGGVEFEDRISLSLTADHQAVDGAAAARFLKAVCANIENIRTLSGIKS